MDFHSSVNVFPCQVQWGDCDPAGIIFYPTYFRWMDAATWAFFESVGYTPKRMREEHLSMPLVSADCQFLSPGAETRVWGRAGPGKPLKGETIPEELKALFRAK
jgi:hypothetical protein